MISGALALEDYNCTDIAGNPSSLPSANNPCDEVAYCCSSLRALESHDVVGRAIDGLWGEWADLDAHYLRDSTASASAQPGGKPHAEDSKLKFAVPTGFYELFKESDASHVNLDDDVSRATCFEGFHHNRIPDEIKMEYLSKLYEIFSRVPRYNHIVDGRRASHLETVRTTNTDSPVPFSSTHIYDDECVPIAPATRTFRDPSASSVYHGDNSSKAAEVIYTFTITDSKNNRMQDIDVSGSSTLSDLKAAIYCVHDRLVSEALSPSKPDSIECGIINDCFFVIEDAFYISAVDITLDIRRFLSSRKQNENSRSKNKTIPSTKRRGKESEATELNCDDVHSIHNTVIKELKLVPGKCYLYTHCYCCEHYLYLSDFKTFPLYCDDAEAQLARYPRSRFARNDKKKKCQVSESLILNAL